MDKHHLICAMKQMALELGRTPKRTEFMSSMKGADYQVIKLFGGWNQLVKACEMETYDERRGNERKIDNSIFLRDVVSHVENHEPADFVTESYPSIATISDIHWPFSSSRVVGKFTDYCAAVQPEWIILNGDAWDMYGHAKFPRSHNIFTPRDEERQAREMNGTFWEHIKAKCPQSKLVQLLGNHDVRPLKRVLETYPAAEDWIDAYFKKLFTFDGVTTIFDPREELKIGSILVFHGYRSQLGAHRDYTLYSTINGHTHQGGVVFRQIRGRVLFELNSGLAGDPDAKGLCYTSQKVTRWTPGFGAVDSLGPRFIPA